MPAAPTIVRDVDDYPDAVAARASLPAMYAHRPYVGELLQPGDTAWMHVFSTEPLKRFLDDGWTTRS
jgi:hypothetical protein